MSFYHHYFNAGHSTNWSWPLRVAVQAAPGTSDFEQYTSGWWAGKFVDLSYIHLLNKGLPSIVIAQYLDELPGHYLEGSIIFIIKHPLHSGDQLELVKLGQSLVEQFAVNGVFFIDVNNSIRDWFEQFIIQLSHNYNLITVLERTTSSGVFYYDKRIESETTLRSVFDTLVEQVKAYLNIPKNASVSDFRISVNYRLPDNVLDFLTRDPRKYRFDHESGEASKLKEASDFYQQMIKNDIKIKGSDGGFSEISETFRRGRGPILMAGPPEEEPSGGAEPLAESAEPDTSSEHPRSLQAIVSDNNGNIIGKENSLEANSTYSISVYIGLPTKGSIGADKTFADELVFEDSKAEEETILIVFKAANAQQLQQSEIVLPRSGNSSTAKFNFNTTDRPFEAEIFAYHKGRLIQQAVFSCPVGKREGNEPVDTMKIRVVFCARQHLQDLKDRTSFGTSIFYEEKNDKEGTLLTVADNKPLDLYFNQGLQQIINDIKTDIENAVKDIDNHPEDLHHENNELLLKRLAYKGNALYVNHLMKKEGLKGPFQIVTKRAEFVPIDFVYTLPPPAMEAKLCKHAIVALEEGECRKCYDHSESPAPFICPFGFLCFSEIIERHRLGKGATTTADYCITAENKNSRSVLPVLQHTLYASTNRIEPQGVSVLKEKILATLKSNSASVLQAPDWNTWSVMAAKHGPDSLILLVHTEMNKVFNVEQLEIGTNDFLIQNLLDQSKLKSNGSSTQPFVIVIGCETADVANSGFDITSQLMNNGAAIVISNFTKIRGRHAGPIVMKLVEYLKANAGKEITLGAIIRKLRQHLLSKGIMVSLALIAQGDADWKIKS